MQRGTRFSILGVPLHVQHCPSEGVQNTYKISDFFYYFQNKGHVRSGRQVDAEQQHLRLESECFVRSPWELFGVHLGWTFFLARTPLRSDEAPRNVQNNLF